MADIKNPPAVDKTTKAPTNKTSTMDTKNKTNVNTNNKDARVSDNMNDVEQGQK
ncbi:MAG: hypothetical protein MZV64_07150 [Ignavibacteriales bacterium]|nr:hypothetical protein [Ignavibacteriales bacterium]